MTVGLRLGLSGTTLPLSSIRPKAYRSPISWGKRLSGSYLSRSSPKSPNPAQGRDIADPHHFHLRRCDWPAFDERAQSGQCARSSARLLPVAAPDVPNARFARSKRCNG